MKSVLILAANNDFHADAVLLELEKRGINSFRFNPEADWCPNSSLIFNQTNDVSFASIKTPSYTLNASELGAVYCRSWNFYRPGEKLPHEEHLRAFEMRAGLSGLLKSCNNLFWMNPPWNEDLVDSKVFQARSAAEFKIPIPETLVTSDPDAAVEFITTCNSKVVIKQLSEVGLTYFDEECVEVDAYGFYTERVTKEQILQGRSKIENAPVLLQRHLEKAADIRVNVVGSRIFAHRIFSQEHESAKIDFRKVIDHRIEPCEFPRHLSNRLVEMISSWGIHFASCDFVETLSGEYIFLEANVTGNWLWLETKQEHPILDAVVSDIVDSCSG